MKKMMKSARLLAAVALLAMAAASMGCYGRFPLTQTVWRVNGDVGPSMTDSQKGAGVINSVVMIVFAIVPVYGLATLGDALVVNSIEFWTGDQVNVAVSDADSGNQATILADESAGRATIESSTGEVELIRVSPTAYDVRQEGVRVGHVEIVEDGAMRCYDAQGEFLREVPADAAIIG